MKTIFLAIALLLVGCGNPHLYSQAPGEEKANPPLTESEEAPACVEDNPITETRFFFGKSGDDFDGASKCRKLNDGGGKFKRTETELSWSFSDPVSGWSATFEYLPEPAHLRLFDCENKLFDEIEVDALATLGFVTPRKTICEVTLSLVSGASTPVPLSYKTMR